MYYIAENWLLLKGSLLYEQMGLSDEVCNKL
jgi:hypothetical protein